MKFIFLLMILLLVGCGNMSTHQTVYISASDQERDLIIQSIDEFNNKFGCEFIKYKIDPEAKLKEDQKSVISFSDKLYDDNGIECYGVTIHYKLTTYDDILINRNRIFNVHTYDQTRRAVIQHELGHMMGFEHQNKWSSIMAPRIADRFWMANESIEEGWNDFIDTVKINFPNACND